MSISQARVAYLREQFKPGTRRGTAKKVTFNCDHCGAERTKFATLVQGRKKYCSNVCRHLDRRLSEEERAKRNRDRSKAYYHNNVEYKERQKARAKTWKVTHRPTEESRVLDRARAKRYREKMKREHPDLWRERKLNSNSREQQRRRRSRLSTANRFISLSLSDSI